MPNLVPTHWRSVHKWTAVLSTDCTADCAISSIACKPERTRRSIGILNEGRSFAGVRGDRWRRKVLNQVSIESRRTAMTKQSYAQELLSFIGEQDASDPTSSQRREIIWHLDQPVLWWDAGSWRRNEIWKMLIMPNYHETIHDIDVQLRTPCLTKTDERNGPMEAGTWDQEIWEGEETTDNPTATRIAE